MAAKEKTYVWRFTKQQAAQVAAIFDVAVRAGGLSVAEQATPITKELTNAINGTQKTALDASRK